MQQVWFVVHAWYFSYLITRLTAYDNIIQVGNFIINNKRIITFMNVTLLILLIFPHFNLPEVLRKYDFRLADSDHEQHLCLAENPLYFHLVAIQPFPWSSV